MESTAWRLSYEYEEKIWLGCWLHKVQFQAILLSLIFKTSVRSMTCEFVISRNLQQWIVVTCWWYFESHAVFGVALFVGWRWFFFKSFFSSESVRNCLQEKLFLLIFLKLGLMYSSLMLHQDVYLTWSCEGFSIRHEYVKFFSYGHIGSVFLSYLSDEQELMYLRILILYHKDSWKW